MKIDLEYQNLRKQNSELFDVMQKAKNNMLDAKNEQDKQFKHLQDRRAVRRSIQNQIHKLKNARNEEILKSQSLINELNQRSEDLKLQAKIIDLKIQTEERNGNLKQVDKLQRESEKLNNEATNLLNRAFDLSSRIHEYKESIDRLYRILKKNNRTIRRQNRKWSESRNRFNCLLAEFYSAEADFEKNNGQFQARKKQLQAKNMRHNKQKTDLAIKAGVPEKEAHSVKIVTDEKGNTNFYFGGIGRPDGLGHGHVAIDKNNNQYYYRDAFRPHGGQNYRKES